MSAAATYPHIEIRADGLPWISETQTKVLEVVQDKLCWGWEADEIHRNHPHLSLAQIHAAFTYYYDHKEEVESVIAERKKEAERLIAEINAQQGESKIRAKLKALGLIP